MFTKGCNQDVVQRAGKCRSINMTSMSELLLDQEKLINVYFEKGRGTDSPCTDPIADIEPVWLLTTPFDPAGDLTAYFYFLLLIFIIKSSLHWWGNCDLINYDFFSLSQPLHIAKQNHLKSRFFFVLCCPQCLLRCNILMNKQIKHTNLVDLVNSLKRVKIYVKPSYLKN